MCQPKSKGGKRCLRHAKLSQFISKFVSLKTGASEELVQNTLSELNREGKARNVPFATGKEVAGLIQRHELEMDVETGFNSHDRKTLNKRLQGAKEETKNGVDGSHFYAWKNLLTRVRSKLRTAVLSVGIIGSLAIGVSGCAAGVTDHQPTVSPSISISATATPTTSPTQTADLGSVTLSGTTVTDAQGTYQTVKLDSNSPYLKYNANLVDSTATSRYSKADILAAQKFVANFVTTQGVDSIAIDNGNTGWDNWKKNEAKKYIVPAYVSNLVNAKSADGGDRPAIIINDLNNLAPSFTRDGGSRIANEALSIKQVTGADDPSVGKYLKFSGNVVVNYRVTKASAVAAILKNNPHSTRAQLEAKYPKVFDATSPNPTVRDTLTFNYFVIKDGGQFKLAGYNNSFAGDFVGIQ